jgi:signal transduction histidine kinase
VALSPRALDLVLLELLENARKFHPTCTPRVQVRAALGTAGTVRLTVEDDGLSLSPEQIAQAFLPYVQGEKYFTGEAAGLGLGLAQVATLVWGVGGKARLYNRVEGSGVIVELTLPGQSG